MTKEFESIYKTHYQKLYTLAFRMTGNKEDAEDVLQLAFVNAYKGFENFKGQSSAYTWLYRILMNTSKRFYKEARKLPAAEFAEEQGISQQQVYAHINSFGKTEDTAITALTREACLQMFMNCMPSKYRAVYTLRIMLHFSTSETAEILEISENLVKVHLHRARKIAQDHIDGRCSLIQPGAMCDCRSYAGYLIKTGKVDVLCNIDAIKNKEQIALEEYTSEMQEILSIDNLYNTQVKAPEVNAFLTRIKNLKEQKELKLLGAL